MNNLVKKYETEWRNVPQIVEEWIRWISPINGKFKLNFNGLNIENKSISIWVIRDSNDTIKMVVSRHISNTSIIMALKDDMLTVKNNKFLNLEINNDLRIVIDYYNKKNNIYNFIMLLIDDIESYLKI